MCSTCPGRRAALLAVLATLHCAPDNTFQELRTELLARRSSDQAIRDTLMQLMQRGEAPDSSFRPRMLAIDSANTEWLKGVIAVHGWPSRSLVGEEAANAAFLLAQHAVHDRAFQQRALQLLETAYATGDATGNQVAYLADRLAVQAGEPQRYGSQFKLLDGVVVFDPIEDSLNIDARRAAVGLPSFAEYVRQVDSIFGSTAR